MHESAALAVTAMRAIETTDRERTLWSDADRAWASRAAAEVVGPGAGAEAFVARRAALTLERLGAKHPALPRMLRAFAWRPWIGFAAAALALIAGAASSDIGSSGHVNILAPPVLALLAWNLAAYVLLAARRIAAWAQVRGAEPGPLRRFVARLSGAAVAVAKGDAPIAAAMTAIATEWSRVAAPLYAARAARVLHVAAAAFAVGVLAGLYVRGIAFEYRASWQSTFLEAAQVRQALAFALAPGAALTGIAVPDVEHIASLRSAAGGGENAARWLHLFAATIGIVVIVPRLVLAIVAGLVERRRERSLRFPLADPYFRRLLRGFREGPLRVRVVPYSFAVPASAVDGIRSVLARAYGARSEISIAPTVPYGAEDAVPDDAIPSGTHVAIALFSATATPETESHGAFAAALAAKAGGECEYVALVDESAFRERWPSDAARLAQRRVAWREGLAPRGIVPVFVHLAAPDLAAAEAALDAAHEAAAR